MEEMSNNDRLRHEYKMIAKFMGYTYFERTKLGPFQHREYPGWFDTKGIDLENIKNSTSVLHYRNPRFIASKTLRLNFKHNYENLMGLVSFIEKLPSQRYGGFEVIIVENTCGVFPKRKSKDTNIGVKMVSELGKKDAIYGACLKFIENYNKTNESN